MDEDWIRRRVETIEFIDLTTTVRTIEYELMPDVYPGLTVLPFGTYVRGQGRGEFKVTDEEGRLLRFLTSKESCEKVRAMAKSLLKSAGVEESKQDRVNDRIAEMLRCDPNEFCANCLGAYGTGRGEKHNEKSMEACRERVRIRRLELGCRSLALALLELDLSATENNRSKERLARLILDVRESYVLFVDVEDRKPTHVRVRFDEELQRWNRPRDVYRDIEKDDADVVEWLKVGHLCARDPGSDNEQGRESQVQVDLTDSARKWRRNLLRWGFTPWHVGFDNHASAMIESSHLNVKVPPELLVSRVRCLGSTVDRPAKSAAQPTPTEPGRGWNWDDLEPRVRFADEVGPRAHLHFHWGRRRERPEGIPSFVSIMITPSSSSLWSRGAILGLITGCLLILIGLRGIDGSLDDVQRDAMVTILVFMPGLLGTIIAIDAETDIGTRLIRNAQKLVVAISGLSLMSAFGVAFWDESSVRSWAVIGFGVLALLIGVYLAAVWGCSKDLRGHQERGRPRGFPAGRERLRSYPPSKEWLLSGEGDRDVPYGWIIEEIKALDSGNEQCSCDRDRFLSGQRPWPVRPRQREYEGIRWFWENKYKKEREEIGELAVALRSIQIAAAKRRRCSESPGDQKVE